MRAAVRPVRHRLDAKAQAAARPFDHTVVVRPTTFQTGSATGADKRIEFQSLYQLLVDDETRNRAICEEVVQAVRDGRSPLILTERNEHLDRFERVLEDRDEAVGQVFVTGTANVPLTAVTGRPGDPRHWGTQFTLRR